MAEAIRIEIVGTDDLLARLDRLENFYTSPRMKAILWDIAQAYKLLAQQAAPKRERYLSRSIDSRIEGFGTSNAKIRVGTNMRYAAAVEFGAGPHPIYPRNKRYLHWFQDAGGNTLNLPWSVKRLPKGAESVYSRGVNHPGNKAQPFLFPHMPIIRQRLVNALEKALNQEMAKA